MMRTLFGEDMVADFVWMKFLVLKFCFGLGEMCKVVICSGLIDDVKYEAIQLR